MKVRMRELMCRPERVCQPGEVVDLPEDLALALVRAHYAEPLSPLPIEPETATSKAPGRARKAVTRESM